jgi:hypothetical protein
MTLEDFYSQVQASLPIYEFLVKQTKDKDMRCSDPDEKYLKCAVKSQTRKIAWALHSWAVTCESKSCE